jgi:hypothetical protein
MEWSEYLRDHQKSGLSLFSITQTVLLSIKPACWAFWFARRDEGTVTQAISIELIAGAPELLRQHLFLLLLWRSKPLPDYFWANDLSVKVSALKMID